MQGGIQGYHEIGRAVATVMSDEVFHDVAYKAQKRDHLLAGLDEVDVDDQLRVPSPGSLVSIHPLDFFWLLWKSGSNQPLLIVLLTDLYCVSKTFPKNFK